MHVPPPPQAPPMPAPMLSTRRGRRTGAAVLVSLLGVAAGVALLVAAGLARAATVEGFARAPVGCTTTLEFDRAGVFTLYLETKGSVDAVEGDCSLNGTSYDHQGSAVAVQASLVDASGNTVAVESVDLSRSYDTGSFRGRSIGVVRVPAPGEYRLTVASDSTDVVVAVGGAPDADSRLLMLAGVAVMVVSVLAGILVAASGRRRPPPAPSAPAPPPGGGAVLMPRPVLQAQLPQAPPPQARPMPPPQWGPPSA